MATIDRSRFSLDVPWGGYSGTVVLSDWRFHVFVKAWDADWVAAWSKAEQGAELFLNRFAEIEAALATQLAPELDHWTEVPVTVADITQILVRSIQATAVIGLHADEQTARLYFDGPPLALGHQVEVALCRDGQVSVGLAG